MDTALLLVPAIAVCAALGWAVGGRAWLAAVWASLAVVLVLWHGLSHITYTASAVRVGARPGRVLRPRVRGKSSGNAVSVARVDRARPQCRRSWGF